jgi:hypothetical protein
MILHYRKGFESCIKFGSFGVINEENFGLEPDKVKYNKENVIGGAADKSLA